MLIKTALDLFSTYKSKEEIQDPSDPSKKRSVLRTKPVLFPEDIKKANKLVGSVLDLDKYKSLITQLQSAVKTSESGIVNFVVGSEVEMADAILKSAFPPGSGVVYGGADGYRRDCSKWATVAVARDETARLIYGNPKIFTQNDTAWLKTFLRDEPDILNGFLAQDFSGPGQGVATVVPQPRQRSGQPAPSGGQPGESPLEVLQRSWEAATTMLKSLRIKKETLDIVDEDKIRKVNAVELLLIQRIRTIEAQIPKSMKGVHSGTPEYDKSGFLDYEPAIYNTLKKAISRLLDPSKFISKVQQSIAQRPRGDNASQAPQISQNDKDSAIKAFFDTTRNQIFSECLDPLIRNPPSPEVKQDAENLKKILSGEQNVVITSSKPIKSLAAKIMLGMQGSGKVLLLNNADANPTGFTVRSQTGLRQSQTTYSSSIEDILKNKYCSTERRAGRSAVLVSSAQITFRTIPDVKVVDMTKFMVDDREAMVILKYYVDEARKKLRENRTGEKGLSINLCDMRKIQQILTGRTQKEALGLLKEAFNTATDAKTKVVDSSILRKAVIEINNRQQGSTRDPEGGKGCYNMEPKKRMEEFIYDLNTDWGRYVEEINAKADACTNHVIRADNLRVQQMAMEDELEVLQSRHDTLSDEEQKRLVKLSAEKATIDQDLEGLENQRVADMQGIKHFLILHGGPGGGKSMYPEVFAKKMNYAMFDVDFSDARGGIVGETESFSQAIIDSWEKLSDVVIRMDEFDGQVANSVQELHNSHDAAVVQKLLRFFQEKVPVLEKRNVFVIATTNNPERIRSQLVDRSKVMFVPDPYSVVNYEKWLNTCVDTIQRERDVGFIYDPDNPSSSTPNAMREATKSLMNGIDKTALAEALMGTQMNFRKASEWMVNAWANHMSYLKVRRQERIFNTDKEQYAREFKLFCITEKTGRITGYKPIIKTGFPFTTENLVKAANLTKREAFEGGIRVPGSSESFSYSDGISAMSAEFNSTGGARTEGADPELALMFEEPEMEPDIMAPAEAPMREASTDYYYESLIKSGVIKGGKVAQIAPVKTKTEPKTKATKPSGDKKDQWYYSDGSMALVPVDFRIIS